MVTRNKTILVTGGCGFIGSHFVRDFLRRHHDFRLINFDKLTYAGNPANLKEVEKNKRYTFVRGDIADARAVGRIFKRYRPAYVVHFAAESHVDRSIHGYAAEFIRTNIHGTFNLLEAARAFGVTKFIQVSTDEVYGSLALRAKTTFNEHTPYAPRSPYSASKASGDMLCRAYHVTYGLPVIITHCSNNYGTHQYPEKLIPHLILQAMADQPLPIYGDGKYVRDWIHVSDHVAALEKILFRGRIGETYNIGGEQELPNIVIAKAILHALKKPESLIQYVPDRPGHDRRYAIDARKIRRELGWKPRRRLETALPETIRWYAHNSSWIRSTYKRRGR